MHPSIWLSISGIYRNAGGGAHPKPWVNSHIVKQPIRNMVTEAEILQGLQLNSAGGSGVATGGSRGAEFPVDSE